MTLNEIAYTIAELLGQADDDTSIARIKSQVITARALLIRRSYDRRQKLPEQLVQDLDCQVLTKADMNECCTVVVNTCKAMKTAELPQPVSLGREIYFRYVGSPDKRREFTFAPYESLDDLLHLRYAGPIRYYTYLNNRVYVISNEGFGKNVNIRGIFEDPRVAANYSNCSGDPCYTDDDDFPAPASMVENIVDIVLKKNTPFVQIVDDREIDDE